jgi:hypothetical protein
MSTPGWALGVRLRYPAKVENPMHRPHAFDVRRGARVRRLGALILLTACIRQRQPSNDGNQETEGRAPITILRGASYLSSDLAAQNQGQLEIAVRSSDRPTQSLAEAHVSIRSERAVPRQKLTDQRGVAAFDSLPSESYELLVRRIGYGVARAVVPVTNGCRTDVEVYISVQAIGISPPPPMPGRVVITTCAPSS